jgi:branched-chain amino acid transport system permease protein
MEAGMKMRASLREWGVWNSLLPLLLVVLATLPAMGLGANATKILFSTLVWMIASIGWNLLGGFAGQVSFGFAVFYGLGAYTAALMINAGVNPYVAFAGAALVSAVASFLVGLPTFRLRGPYFVIATIGVTEAVRVVMSNLQITGGASGVRINEAREFRPLEHYYAALGAAAIAVLVSLLIERSRFGLALRAIKQDEDAAADIGVNAYRAKLWVHAIAAALTGIAGGLYARRAAFIDPDGVFAFSNSISILLMPVIGGIGSTWGAVLGAFIFGGLVEEKLVSTFPQYHLVINGLLLMVIVLLEPDGLVGLLRRIFRRRVEHSGSRETDKVLWGRGRLEGREL